MNERPDIEVELERLLERLVNKFEKHKDSITMSNRRELQLHLGERHFRASITPGAGGYNHITVVVENWATNTQYEFVRKEGPELKVFLHYFDILYDWKHIEERKIVAERIAKICHDLL
jgi:hypothetical protein